MLLLLPCAFAQGAPAHSLRDLRGALEEVRTTTDGVRTAVLAYKELNKSWQACGTPEEAKARGSKFDRTKWEGGTCWTVLAWDDPGLIRGGYWITLTPTGFEVHGVFDGDGDGVYAEYVATESKPAATVTPPDEY
jgi:hypothetical protein